MRGAQQLRLEHGAGSVGACLQYGGRRPEQLRGRGALVRCGRVGGGVRWCGGGTRGGGGVGGRGRGRVRRGRSGRFAGGRPGLFCGCRSVGAPGLLQGDGSGRRHRGPVQAVRGQQAAATDRVRAGHRTVPDVEPQFGGVVEGDPHGVTVADRWAARELGHSRVQPFAQPGREGRDESGRHAGGDGRKLRGHVVFSPIQRASSSGLRAATGMPAATSRDATPVE